MSSCLCKKAEGAVFPFVLLIHSVEDGVDDSVYALDVDEADHGSGAASHLHEASLDDVGGAQLSPQVPGKAEEGKQLRQVSLQSLHRLPSETNLHPPYFYTTEFTSPRAGSKIKPALSATFRL